MPAPFAKALTPLAAMATRAFALIASPRQSFGSAPAPDASRLRNNAGGLQSHPLDAVIAHRAERLCNRDRALVAKYVRVQMILSRGR